MSSPEGGEIFRLSRSDFVLTNLLRLRGVALRFGQIEAFERAREEIDIALQTRPLVFGEAMYPLRFAHVAMRVGAIRPLSVVYGVYEHSRVVFVTFYRLMAMPGE